MTIAIRERMARPDGCVKLTMNSGRWVAFAGFAYVAAWLVGLTVGIATSSPDPTDSIQKIGGYYAQHREAAMIMAYLVDGVAGTALLALAAGL